MQPDRFDHIVITVRDAEKAVDFYTRILGMKADTANGRCALRFGRQKINLHTVKGEFQPAAAEPTYGSQDICLIVRGDIREIRRELDEKGWPVELGVVPRTGALGPMESVYVRDPDGNLIELSVYAQSG